MSVTVPVVTGRNEMPMADQLTLDELSERLERMPVPEGCEVEIVEGSVQLPPQRWTHRGTIRKVLRPSR